MFIIKQSIPGKCFFNMVTFGTHFIPVVMYPSIHISFLQFLLYHYQCLLQCFPILYSSNVTLLLWVLKFVLSLLLTLTARCTWLKVLAFYYSPFLLIC